MTSQVVNEQTKSLELNATEPSCPDIDPFVPRQVIQERSADVAVDIYDKNTGIDSDEPFFVVDMKKIESQYRRWCSQFPRIQPHYAVKCNPDDRIVRKLYSLGGGFDCASKEEIDCVLQKGVPPSSIIYANPCKQESHIKFAKSKGVDLMTFDNEDELLKIRKNFPEARLIIRILPDPSKAKLQLGKKFGASLLVTKKILLKAMDLGLNVVGVSFHVGSQCTDPTAFKDALLRARKVFDEAIEVGYHPVLLDIGGGFPGVDSDTITLESIAQNTRNFIDELFPQEIRVISEPGRYFVTEAFTLVAQITSRRLIEDESEKKFMYYLNDGIYGSFNNVVFDHAVLDVKIIKRKKVDNENLLYSSIVWGPTCDSVDCIMENAMLPELSVGDWVRIKNMGAYTIAAASNFNGFEKAKLIYVE